MRNNDFNITGFDINISDAEFYEEITDAMANVFPGMWIAIARNCRHTAVVFVLLLLAVWWCDLWSSHRVLSFTILTSFLCADGARALVVYRSYLPFVSYTLRGTAIVVHDGTLTALKGGAIVFSVPLSACCWCEINSLRNTFRNSAFGDLGCILVAKRHQTLLSINTTVACGLTDRARGALRQTLVFSQAINGSMDLD